jgi:uncharacterized protein with PIN domain
MTTLSVRCPTQACGGVAFVSKSRYEDADELLHLRCQHGHVFEYDKRKCPRCGSPMEPAERRPMPAWAGNVPPPRTRLFRLATCTRCDYEGPKQA